MRINKNLKNTFGVLVLTGGLALVMACTPMDHTNPYDPAAALTAPNKVGFSVANNVKEIGSTTASIHWNRNTESEFYAYLVLRDTTDPGAPSAITAEMQTELMAISAREVGALYGSSAVAVTFPKTAAGLKAVAFLPDANLTSFDDAGLTESTVYHYRILTLTKNLKTFAVSSNLVLETTPDKVGPSYSFYQVYSPYSLDAPRVIYDVDYDPSTAYLWISGTARGLLMQYGISTNYQGDEYFVAGIPVTSSYFDLENSSHMLFLSGYPGTESPTRLRGIMAKGGSVYVGVLRDKTGLWRSGGLWEIASASTKRGLVALGASLHKGTNYAGSGPQTFGDWGSLLAEYSSYCLFFNDINTNLTYYDTVTYWADDLLNGYAYNLVADTETNQLVNGLTFDDNGRVYSSSLRDSTIRKYNLTTGVRVWTRGGSGALPGQYQEVGDVAYYRNAAGTRERIYVADPINNRITVYNEEGDLISWIDTVKVFGREGLAPRGLKVYGNTMFITGELGVLRFDL